MAKQDPHNNDAHDNDQSKGPNKPGKAVEVTTGSYKKQETYQQQAREHKDPGAVAQGAKHEWNEDTRDKPSIEGAPRDRNADGGDRGQ